MVASFVILLGLTLFLAVVIFAVKNPIIAIYDNYDEGLKSLYILVPAVFFFAINKVNISFLNGRMKLGHVGILNGLRGGFMLVFFYILVFAGVNGDLLSILFLLSEATLAIISLIVVRKFLKIVSLAELKPKVLEIFKFSRNAFLGNLLADIYLKIDVIVLGYFINDEMVGLYSFVAFFFEGFNQLAIVTRTFLNPKLLKLYLIRSRIESKLVFSKLIRKSYLLHGAFGIITLLGLPFIIYITGQYTIEETLPIYSVLIFGGVLYSGFNPVIQFFNQSNFPKTQTLFWSLTFSINLILNLILVSTIGMFGAAIATAITFTVKPFLFVYLLNIIDYKITWKQILFASKKKRLS